MKPGVVELLDFLAGRGLPLAVATSAGRAHGRAPSRPRRPARPLRRVATRDDVEHPKPHPDIYLEAARRLGVAPERCVAFEDSSIGLIAAHAAGMRAVMVPDILPPTEEARQVLRRADDLHEVLTVA